MRTNALRVAVTLALGIFGAACEAQAATIDFTSLIWSGASGKSSFSASTLFDGIKVTVSSTSGLLTFNSGGDVNSGCVAGTGGLACKGDGLGVGDDEVTSGSERLNVYFSAPVSITGLGFLDLFGPPSNKSGDAAAETARWYVYSPSQSSSQSVTGTDQTSTLGYKAVSTSYTNVTQLRFYATTPTNSDFALASIKIAPSKVAEPATLLLSGIGFVFLSSFRSRRRSS
ncbi:MAG TPA: hypothetical protein VI485_27210 [Vicinamibacterales bacterium]|nr:hypothetical protein [Vicinamibacterales bacterium]